MTEDRDNEAAEAIDPPKTDGGTKSSQSADSGEESTATAIDPPKTDGGT
jgi:hypothetical protein